MSVQTQPPTRSRTTSGKLAPRISNELRALAKTLAIDAMAEGLSAPDAQTLLLEAYFGLALQRSRHGNGRVNRSRVELLTGINRKAISKRIQPSDVWTLAHPIPWVRRVTLGWQKDRRYLDARGKPRTLRYEDSTPSFISLGKNYATSIPPRALLNALKDLGLVDEVRGTLRLRRV